MSAKKKYKEPVEGDIIKVPFMEGYHTYARILHYGDYALYDCRTPNGESKSLDEIIQSKILFTAHVDVFAVKEDGWEVIGNIPLEKHLERFYARYFMPAASNDTNISFYKVYKQEILEAIEKDWIGDGKMQMGGIYGAIHIHERLSDYYEKRNYIDNKASMNTFYEICKFRNIEL